MAAAAGTVSVAKLEGLYKEVYGTDGPTILVPENAKLYKAIGDLAEAERVGKTYNFPVVLQLEQGYTAAGSDGDSFAINSPVAMVMDNASLEGSEGLLATRLSYRAATKAASSKAAFKRAMGVSMESHMRSHIMRREIEMWYGRSATGLATTTAITASTADVTCTISAATWAVGLWAGMEGASYSFYATSDGALAADSSNVTATLKSVDPDNKQLTFTCSSTTLASTLDSGNTYYIDFAGYRATMTTTHKAMEGLDYALTLAAGNTLWGLSTDYTLWRGNSYSVASTKLTLGKVLQGVNKAVGKAGLDEAVDLYVSPETWADLADSFSASRMTDSSYSTSEGKNGVEKVVYFGANGAINVKIHSLVKGGEAWALPVKRLKKVGSTDVTLKNPGRGDQIFLELASNAGFEYRSYSDFALLVEAPAKCVKFTTIVNGS